MVGAADVELCCPPSKVSFDVAYMANAISQTNIFGNILLLSCTFGGC